MIAFTHILCPIDFSEASARACAHAAALARWYQARLTVLHVSPGFEGPLVAQIPPGAGDAPHPGSRDDLEARIRLAIARTVTPGITARAVAQEGRPTEIIVNAATAMKAALAKSTHLPVTNIGLKATTNEGVDEIGRGLAIAAHAVALIAKA